VTSVAQPAHACHHVGIRVADLTRAVSFYSQALGGTQLTRPFTLTGPFPEQIYGAGPGATVTICHVGFEGGSGVELFQFTPARPRSAVVPADGSIIHAAFRVAGVPEAVAAVAAAGGSLVGDIVDWGGKPFAYCTDPDGNVLELAEVSFAGTVDLVEQVFPGSKIVDGAATSSEQTSSEQTSSEQTNSEQTNKEKERR